MEQAKQFTQKYERLANSSYIHMTLDSFELNSPVPQLQTDMRACTFIMCRDGSTYSWAWDYDADIKLSSQYNFLGPVGHRRDGLLECTIYAKSQEHAAKIANEKRIELIASDKWDK